MQRDVECMKMHGLASIEGTTEMGLTAAHLAI